MSDQSPQTDLTDLDHRLKQARERERALHDAPPPDTGDTKQGLSQALRVGSELVSALIVGAGLGWLLDQWLETTPFLMILFFFLGSAAGILNVFRVTGMVEARGPSAPGGANLPPATKGLDKNTPASSGAYDEEDDKG